MAPTHLPPSDTHVQKLESMEGEFRTFTCWLRSRLDSRNKNETHGIVQVRRLCMDDAPVPYASSMEKAVVKRGEDLIAAVLDLAKNA